MLKTILGTKVGMTQIFDETGNIIPVTVINVGPCIVTKICKGEKEGYNALQLGFGSVKEKNVSKPLAGQFKKGNLPLRKYIREFRVSDVSSYQIGQEIKVDMFQSGDYVDVTGVSKGKGYAGGVKRHNFRGGPTTHGQSDRLRAPGSIGGQGPQRVLRGMRMAGHLGQENVTVQRLKVISVDAEKNTMLIRGAMPGVNGGLLVISKTVKKLPVMVIKTAGKADKKKGAAPSKGKK
jgi:large subunit ribosomal protein L3